MSESERYLHTLQRFGIKPGLERIRALMALAGEPHLTFPSVLVGGTNGKGSTVAFLASLLQAAGLRVGVYTSPPLGHLPRALPHQWSPHFAEGF